MKKYESYKESGVNWIAKIPENWIVARIGFFSDVYRGSGYQILNEVDDDFIGKKEKVLRIGDFNSYNPIWCEYREQFENYRINKNDLLIGGTGHYFGKSLCVSEDMVGLIHSYNIIRLVINNLDSKFVFYWISSPLIREQMDISVLGAGQPFIDIKGLKDLKILTPTLKEQTQIANYLDHKTTIIDALIDKKEQLIKKLQAQRQAIINEAVTKGLNKNAKMKNSGIEWLGEIPEHWEVVKLKQIAEAFGRIGYRGYTTSDIVGENEGAITISPSNMKGNYMTFENSTYISWEKYEESPEIKIFNDDILMVKTGSTYGKVGIVKNLKKKATVNPQVLVLKSVKINPDYLFNLLRTNYIKYQIETNVIGSTIPTISQTKVLNFSFPLPPNNEIEEIINFIQIKMDLIDKTQKSLERVIKKLKSYRQSIISEAVTGKIDVRDWQAQKK